MKTLYLITGAAGHLGSAIVRQLIAAGKRIRALVLKGDRTAQFLPPEVEQVQGDLLDQSALNEFFRVEPGTETKVIHCAGIVSTDSHYSQAVYDVNVKGTQNIVEKCRENQTGKLVYVSSVHAIPVLPAGKTMTEITRFSPDTVVGPYARTKALATASVQDAVSKGLNASIVFPGGIFGPYDYGRGHVTQLIIDYYQGRMPIGIKGGFDFVDVRDVAAGVIACADKGRTGEGYLLTNRYVSVPELFETLHEVTGKKRTRHFIPPWLARAFVPLFGLYYKLKKQPPLFNDYSIHTLTVNSDYCHEKAARELGYQPRPFADTARDTVEWLKSVGRM